MAITLSEEIHNRKLNGSNTVSVAAGQNLKIETSPDGEEILDEECPAGKQWSVKVSVEIIETDA